MGNPLRSEEDAFRITLAVLVIAAPVALTAVLFGGGPAVGVAGGLAFAGLIVLLKARNEPPGAATGLAKPSADDHHRILVVANETLSGSALRDEIEYRVRGRATSVRVVCPALNTKLRHWTNEEDDARAAAQQRVDAVLAGLSELGIDAGGDIGNDDPVQAIEDALRIFSADEVIVSTHPPGRSNWLETDVVRRARARFPVSITHIVVDLTRDRTLASDH